MRNMWGLVLAAGFIACADSVHHPTTSDVEDRFIRTTTGTVQSYTAGERIVIAGSDGTDLSLPLDAGARVDDTITEGQTVTVAWLTNSLGRPRVTSIAPFSPGPAEAAASGSASSAPPSKAYASAEEGSAMSATPASSLAETPRPTVTPVGSVPTPPGATGSR